MFGGKLEQFDALNCESGHQIGTPFSKQPMPRSYSMQKEHFKIGGNIVQFDALNFVSGYQIGTSFSK